MQFIPDLGILLSFTAATVIIAITPGPDMTFFLGRTIHQGKSYGNAALLGAMSGSFVHTLLAAFGISALLAASQTAFVILKLVGAGYLLWLAIQAIMGGSSLNLDRGKRGASSFLSIWLAGIGINLLNPKIVLFFVTFFPQFVAVDDPHALEKLVFLGAYFIAVNYLICTGIIAVADRFVAALAANARISRMIDYSFAGIFGLFAVKILMSERL